MNTKSLKYQTRHIMIFYKTSSSYDWEELVKALNNRGYQISVREKKDDKIIADVYLSEATNLIPLVSLCEANRWGVGYSNDTKKRLKTTYVRGQMVITTIEI